MRHWQQTDPARFQAIPESEREAFFAQLGAQVESEIQTLADALTGPDRPGENYLEKVGRLNMARFNAESDILWEMVLIPDPDDAEIDERPATGPLPRDRVPSIAIVPMHRPAASSWSNAQAERRRVGRSNRRGSRVGPRDPLPPSRTRSDG